MSEELKKLFRTNLYFNGVNGVTGKYALPPMPSKRLARLVQGKAEPGELEKLFGKEKPLEAIPEEQQNREKRENPKNTRRPEARNSQWLKHHSKRKAGQTGRP